MIDKKTKQAINHLIKQKILTSDLAQSLISEAISKELGFAKNTKDKVGMPLEVTNLKISGGVPPVNTPSEETLAQRGILGKMAKEPFNDNTNLVLMALMDDVNKKNGKYLSTVKTICKVVFTKADNSNKLRTTGELYKLQNQGFVESEIIGRTRVYCATKQGISYHRKNGL